MITKERLYKICKKVFNYQRRKMFNRFSDDDFNDFFHDFYVECLEKELYRQIEDRKGKYTYIKNRIRYRLINYIRKEKLTKFCYLYDINYDKSIEDKNIESILINESIKNIKKYVYKKLEKKKKYDIYIYILNNHFILGKYSRKEMSKKLKINIFSFSILKHRLIRMINQLCYDSYLEIAF